MFLRLAAASELRVLHPSGGGLLDRTKEQGSGNMILVVM